ncbi:MAG: hypothetical protein A4E19_18930 [Nitrospira sp. SG-bin1]|nr:MAG: hypothetical protein A4E19_18930 [Nitrospira sp. SG-bin1]
MAFLVDDKVGIIRTLKEDRKEAGAPDFVYHIAQTCDIDAISPGQNAKAFLAAGVAIDRETSLLKAAGEAVERYCAAQYVSEHLPLASSRSAAFPCMHPREFALYTPEQYKHRRFPYKPFTETTPLRWSQTLDLLTGETIYVPAAMIYQPYLYNRKSGEDPIFPQMSTGLACHTNPTLAALTALNEVVERDAVAITWQAQNEPPHIRVETLSQENRDIVKRLERPGAEITILYLAMDHGIPVILSSMQSHVSDAPALAVAAAAHLDTDRAIRKSLEELGQTWSFAQWLKTTNPKFSPGKRWLHVVDPETHALMYCNHTYAGYAQFLFNSPKRMACDEIPNCFKDEPTADLRLSVEKINRVNHRVLLADITTDDVRHLGLFVMRAVIPGFHPLFMGHLLRALGGTRLWEVPQRLGHRGISRGCGDNPFPHPFP